MEGNLLPAALCLFEDSRFPNFFPLTLNRPAFDLYIGTQTLRRRLVAEMNPAVLVLLCREYLAPVLREREVPESDDNTILVNESVDGEMLFLNGRLLPFENELEELLSGLESGSIIEKKGVPIAARLSGETAASFMAFLSESLSDEAIARVVREIKEASEAPAARKKPVEGKPEEVPDVTVDKQPLAAWAEKHGVSISETGIRLLSHYWHLIGDNNKCINDDYQKNPLRGTAPESELFKGVDLINEEDIVIGAEVEVRSGTVLDASEGPIIIADRVQIEPNAIIYGPCSIGEGAIIRGGAKIGHATSIGKQCRIGGEVEETIISPYTNKQHEGFIGHSYVGSWVNIGAGSCNSDLKNNYGKIKAWSVGRIRDTGRRFLGTVIGDHSKVAINTKINTGTVVGFNANVMSAGFPPKYVPSYTWAIEPDFIPYELDKAVETAKIMMDRRNVDFSSTLEELFKAIFKLSRQSGHSI